jgi:hypothetical protein
LSSFVIALVGLFFTYSYNERQADRDHAAKLRENRIREVELVQKFIPQLTGSESEKRIAIIAISSLGNTELATKIAALDRSEGSKKALEAIARRGATEGDRNLAQMALQNFQSYAPLIPKIHGGSRVGRKALDIALGELKKGSYEEGGANMGPQVKKYLESVGLHEGLPWSAAFISWCFAQALDPPPFTPSAAWITIWKEFEKKGWLRDPDSGYTPQSGDIVFFERPGRGIHHGGIVMLQESGVVYVIEGNVIAPGGRSGEIALARPHKISKTMSFGHVPDA